MKLTKLFLLSIAVIFLSCSEDEDPLPTSQGMVGTWNIAAVDYSGVTSTTVLGATAKVNFTGTGKDMNVVSTFNENPNTVETEGSYVIELKTTAGGQTTTEDVAFEDVALDGTWTLDGRALTITGPVGPQKASVLEQTATKLKISMDLKETQSAQGITITTDIKTVFTFTKN